MKVFRLKVRVSVVEVWGLGAVVPEPPAWGSVVVGLFPSLPRKNIALVTIKPIASNIPAAVSRDRRLRRGLGTKEGLGVRG